MAVQARTAAETPLPQLLGIDDTVEAALEWIEQAFERGWTDGLPVVPPTQRKVEEMLAAADRDPVEVLGEVQPKGGLATVEAVAVQAVMGGCKPAYFPVVLAAVEAMLEEPFNLNGIQSTTGGVAPLCIVSGPIVNELGVNSGTNLLGGGFRANGTIGRAIRLVLWNLGGGIPDSGDKSPEGHPGKWTYCIAERQEMSAWEPLHVERGLPAEASCVTMFGTRLPYRITDTGGTALGMLDEVAAALTREESGHLFWGGQNLLIFNPNSMGVFKEGNWSRRDVKQYLFEKAHAPVRQMFSWIDERAEYGVSKNSYGFQGDMAGGQRRYPSWVEAQMDNPDAMVPAMRDVDSILLLCAGGTANGWIDMCPGWGYMGGLAVTKPIRR